MPYGVIVVSKLVSAYVDTCELLPAHKLLHNCPKSASERDLMQLGVNRQPARALSS